MTVFNEQAEAGILARLLLDPTQLPVLADKLGPEDFHLSAFRLAYAEMQRLSQEHRAIDLTTLGSAGDGLAGLIAELTPGHHAPLEEYAEIIRRDAFRRRMIGTLDRVIRKAETVEDRQELLTALSEATATIMAGVEDGNLMSATQAVDLYRQTLGLRAAGINGLPYGVEPLDRLIQPAKGGDMIVVAARPSVGKSALADMVADSWSSVARYPVLFVSIEMSIAQLMDRAVARLGGLDASRVVRGLLNDQEKQLAEETLEARRSVNVWYLDDPHATSSSVRAAAAKVRMLAGGISGIVVDYLQILKDKGDSEVHRVTQISRQIKAIAREFDVPLMVLSQLNRAVEARDDPHPKLFDLRESGAIEQDADLVMGLTRQLGTEQLDIDVLKNRQGPLGRVYLYFDPQRVTFYADELRESVEDAV